MHDSRIESQHLIEPIHQRTRTVERNSVLGLSDSQVNRPFSFAQRYLELIATQV